MNKFYYIKPIFAIVIALTLACLAYLKFNVDSIDNNSVEKPRVGNNDNLQQEGISVDTIQALEGIKGGELFIEGGENPELLYYHINGYDEFEIVNAELISQGRQSDAKELKQLVDSRCYVITTDKYIERIESVHGKDSEVYNMLKEFCKGYDIDDSLHDLSYKVSLQKNKVISERLLSSLADGLEYGNADNVLLEAIHAADSPFELEAVKTGVALFIALSKGYQFKFGDEIDELITLDEISILNAISIFGCNKFKHCNKGGLGYINTCSIVGNLCKNYTNTVDVMYARLSQIEIQQVEKALSGIYRYNN